jgi:DNA-directed RNA polymerase specialized sigma24 family protein
MPVDHFPSTHATWIDAQLTIAEDGDRAACSGDAVGRARAEAARDALRRHLMERYADALRAYVRGSSLREMAEVDELVNGFFADAVARPDFLRDWRTHGGPLRRWMINGMLFHARGMRRDAARRREHGVGDAAALEAIAPEHNAGAVRAFERSWANALLRSVCERVRAALEAEGDAHSFDAFRRHVIDGRTHAEVAGELGLPVAQVARLVRTVTDWVRAETVRVLIEEGVHRDDAQAELRHIEELLGE